VGENYQGNGWSAAHDMQRNRIASELLTAHYTKQENQGTRK